MPKGEKAILKRLLDKGRRIFEAPPKRIVPFTGNSEADSFLNDLRNYPHAFVLACLMDRQTKAENAWIIPFNISKTLQGFSIDILKKLTSKETQKLISTTRPIHRLHSKMGPLFHSCINRIVNEYDGDAARIWKGKPSSAELVYRFLQFDGIGPKISTMATNILARDFKVPLSDYYSVDISADVHVKRVFTKLGLCDEDPTPEQIIYKARSLHPEFPGLLDMPCFEIGRNWCRPQKPLCQECYMKNICPSAAQLYSNET